MLSVLEVREQLIAKLALLAGMRSGEIFGLKWARMEADYADIRQRVYRGDVDSPKSTRSVRYAALSDGLLAAIDEWRAVSRPGIKVTVELSVLVQRIIVSPSFPPWAIKSLQRAVDAAFAPAASVRVESSVLLDRPMVESKLT